MPAQNTINTIPINTIQTSPTDTVWYDRITDWIRQAGSDDEKKRAYGRLHISLLTRPLALKHLPLLWAAERQKRDRHFQMSGWIAGLFLAAVVVMLVPTWLHPDFRHDVTRYFYLIQGISCYYSFRNSVVNRSRGLIYALVQHRNGELAPLLVEALPLTTAYNPKQESLREPVMAALTHLLPRFMNADLPALNERQRRILDSQLTHYARRLRDTRATVTPEEAEFLAAVLATLQPDRSLSQARKRVLQALDDLATERHDPAQEPGTRTRVREAARQTIIRLLAS